MDISSAHALLRIVRLTDQSEAARLTAQLSASKISLDQELGEKDIADDGQDDVARKIYLEVAIQGLRRATSIIDPLLGKIEGRPRLAARLTFLVALIGTLSSSTVLASLKLDETKIATWLSLVAVLVYHQRLC